jgi:hypothetical protein
MEFVPSSPTVTHETPSFGAYRHLKVYRLCAPSHLAPPHSRYSPITSVRQTACSTWSQSNVVHEKYSVALFGNVTRIPMSVVSLIVTPVKLLVLVQ